MILEILRDGDTRWREVRREPQRYHRLNELGHKVADIVVHVPVIVHVQEKWGNGQWLVTYADWENARPAPTAWQRFKAWLTYPQQRCLPEATARDRWVGAIERTEVVR